MLLDERELRRTEDAVIAISAVTFGILIYGYSLLRPWNAWDKIAALAVSGAFSTTAIVMSQGDIRITKRQRHTQEVNDDIYAYGLESYKTQVMQELNPSPPRRTPVKPLYFEDAGQLEALPESTDSLRVYNWSNIAEEASGCLVAGPSGYGKTSIGAGYLVGMLTQQEAAEVIVLDIHAAKNRIWKELGFPRVIDDASEIHRVAEWLIGEIETRKRSDRHNLIVLLDEVNDLLSELEHADGKRNGERVKNLIYCIRKLSNGRKFGITLIVFGQSHNCEAIGIDGKFRNNFSLVLVGESARYEINQNFKKDTIESQVINQTPYPCVVSGNLPLTIADHPTHGEYEVYKKTGNPPKNLIRPNFILEDWLIPSFGSGASPEVEALESSNHRPNPSDFNLVKEPDSPPDSKPFLSEGEELARKILEWVISKGGVKTLKEIKDGNRWAKGYSDEILLAAFSALQENNLAEFVTEEKPGGRRSYILKVKPPM